MLLADLPASSALSFLGDAVHSHYIRDRLVRAGISHAGDLNRAALKYVTAPRQADALRRILPTLTEQETAVYRRAYNTTHINRPKNVSGEDYRAATGFEAVLGFLSYTGNPDRLHDLLAAAYAGDATLCPPQGPDSAGA